jgi:hypothetical protein
MTNKRSNRGAFKYSKDPLYEWLVTEILAEFEFLTADYEYEVPDITASARGVSVRYVRESRKIDVWCELGGRPELDLIRDGKRQSMNYLITLHCPNQVLPERPEYSGITTEKQDFQGVLRHFSRIMRGELKEQFLKQG